MAADTRKRRKRSDDATDAATTGAAATTTPPRKRSSKSTASKTASASAPAGRSAGGGAPQAGPTERSTPRNSRSAGSDGRSPRQRVRAETLERILTIAHDQLLAEGADALSLRSVARELGMVSSAVYRYVDSREDLMARLAARAGGQLSEAVDAALRNRRGDAARRFPVLARAVRSWATEHPGDFALLYGRATASPAGGPGAGGAGAAEAGAGVAGGDRGRLGLLASLIRLYSEAGEGSSGGGRVSPTVRRELGAVAGALDVDAAPDVVARAMTAWSGLVGAVAVEVSGQLAGVAGNESALFDLQVDRIAAATGLGG